MPEDREPKPDKLALVRSAGEAIREDLKANVIARIGEEVTAGEFDEASSTLAQVLGNYLRMILPDVEVTAFVKFGTEKASFLLRVKGEIEISIAPGATDDELLDEPKAP